MEKEIRIDIEPNLLCRAKRQAAEEGRSLSNLIQDAVNRYLTDATSLASRCEVAFNLFCEQPIRITTEQFRAVLLEDS